MEQLCFSATHKDEKIEKNSSSGGAFTAITDAWFSEHGEDAVVYGCILDENLDAKHIRATSKEERNRMRGSKYVASDITGVYGQVKADLEQGLFVAFSGTPCQIAGLLQALKNGCVYQEQQLLTIEVICNGVGSNAFFKDYIAHLEKRYKGKAISCNFRGKSRAGSSTCMEIEFDNGKRFASPSTRFDWFYSAYYGGYLMRKGCFQCPFAVATRVADISIGDMHRKGGNTCEDGKSVMIANSSKGVVWAKKGFESMNGVVVDEKELHQPRLRESCAKPQGYERFWNIYKNQGYLAAQRYLGNNTLKGRVKSFVAKVLNGLHIATLVKKTLG